MKFGYWLGAAAAIGLSAPAVAADKDKDQAQAQDQKGDQKQKLICHTDSATGSLTRKVRTCKTADEWRESNQKTRDAVDDFTHDAAAPQQASNPLGG